MTVGSEFTRNLLPTMYHPGNTYIRLANAASDYLHEQVLNLGGCQYSSSRNGTPLSTSEEFLAQLAKLDLHLLEVEYHVSGTVTRYTYAGPDTLVQLDLATSGYTNITWRANSDLQATKLLELQELLLHTVQPSALYVIVKTEAGFHLQPLAQRVGCELLRANYTDSMLGEFDRAVADLKTSTPRGRLILLDGPTGSGKTWAVRGLMHACPNRLYIHCQTSMLAYLDSPEFIATLLNCREEEQTIVLILEDGDSCLVPRGNDNMALIQPLLNYGDGLLGEALDMRAIITSNASHLSKRREEIDEALLRKGRLSARITVTRHTGAKANAILHRLVGEKAVAEGAAMSGVVDNESKGWTLATIYDTARNWGWIPPAKELVKPPRKDSSRRVL